MRLFVAFVHDLTTSFDRSRHCDPTAPIFSFSMTEAEDELATIELSREQSGWGMLSPSVPKCVLVSWSATGRPEDAVLLARARINELPGDLLGRRQVLRAVCAPKDVDRRILAWAKANRASGPETSFLFTDADPEDASSYLLGRSEVFHVDPVTHAIRTIAETKGDRELNMSNVAFFENGQASDGPGEYGRMCRTLRATLRISWTQEASGVCDVGPRIRSPRSPGAPFETLDPSFADNLQGMLTTDLSEGWSVGSGGYRYTIDSFPSYRMASGTVYVQEERNPWEVRIYDNPPTYTLSWRDQNYINTFPCELELEVFRLQSVRLPMAYSYSQPREEVVYAALDLPVRDTGIEDDEDELVEWTLKSPFEDPRARDWTAGETYKAGDVVRHNGLSYRCRADHYAVDFRQVYQDFDFGPPTTFSQSLVALGANAKTYWQEIPLETSVVAASYSIADTDLGREAIRHLMHRLRKEGIRRLRARRIGMRFRWQDAAHLTRADSITIAVHDRDPVYGVRRLVPVTGKILTIRREWPENGPATIYVEIGVTFSSGEQSPPSEAYVEGDFYLDDEIVVGGMGYVVEGDPIRKPVDVARLRQPEYSIVSMRVANDARRQMAAAQVLASNLQDVRRAPQVCPSYAVMSMRSLAPSETLRREIDVVGYLDGVPGGSGVTV